MILSFKKKWIRSKFYYIHSKCHISVNKYYSNYTNYTNYDQLIPLLLLDPSLTRMDEIPVAWEPSWDPPRNGSGLGAK